MYSSYYVAAMAALTATAMAITLYMAWVSNPGRRLKIHGNNGAMVYRREIVRRKTCEQFYLPLVMGVGFLGTYWFYLVPNVAKSAIISGFGFWVAMCACFALAAYDQRQGFVACLAERGIAPA